MRPKEIAVVREELLTAQNNLCALCREQIATGQAVLDHDHKTGQIRGVLHRGCNAFEGTVVNALPRNLITAQRLANIMNNLVAYQKALKPLLHPTHKTAEEKLARTKKRAKTRRQNKNNQKD